MEATPICQAWLRPDGGKGIRNKVLVLYTVECSKHVAESIAAHFQAQHRDVDVTGSLACLDNQAVVQRMLAYCVHPNVGAVLIVGHGCEYIEPDRIRDFARAHGRPAEAFYLQKVGGTEAGIALGCRLVGEMLEKIGAGPRAPMYAQELIIGAKCGGSGLSSGMTSSSQKPGCLGRCAIFRTPSILQLPIFTTAPMLFSSIVVGPPTKLPGEME